MSYALDTDHAVAIQNTMRPQSTRLDLYIFVLEQKDAMHVLHHIATIWTDILLRNGVYGVEGLREVKVNHTVRINSRGSAI